MHSTFPSSKEDQPGMPALAMAAAAWSWVEKMLQLDQRTWKSQQDRAAVTQGSEAPRPLDKSKEKPWS